MPVDLLEMHTDYSIIDSDIPKEQPKEVIILTEGAFSVAATALQVILGKLHLGTASSSMHLFSSFMV